ncbi:PEP/pyruvate-binding domain-containing protein [Nonomuraea rosea]|uniref:PEP/pyruvate-binding domain-containing protein n=1 Tax=Nonomuraea rosea TaxID=638574 RepID=A0ABP7AAK4_9ACTN
MNNKDDPLVLALDDAHGATLEQAGGKGSSLARMAAAGLPVPPGFHLTTAAYRHFVAVHGLQESILQAAATAAPDRPATCEAAAEKIAGLMAGQPMPEEVAQAISTAYARLGEDVAVAVRSSATAEDLPEMSFAGQQETYLNIRGEAAVLDAVKRCWASLWTGRAIGYRARQGIDSADVSLAVVVQELVPADAAGVMFTANPLTGDRDQVMINAAWGLGEAIVSGQVTPDTLVVAKSDGEIIRHDVSDKQLMTVRTPTGTHEEPVPAGRRDQAVLGPEQAVTLARAAATIEELYGRPMDIEWAMRDDRLFIVQARPITALPDAAPVTWELPDPKGRYVRASVTELLPDPLSPLFATLGVPAWEKTTLDFYREARLAYFDEPLAVINGYLYYNVRYTPGLLARMAVAQPRFLTVTLPRRLRSAPDRWRRAHARYTALTERLQAIDVSGVPAAELLEKAREIVEEASRYYLTIQSGVLPAAYISESMFTSVYKLVRRRADPPPLTFLLGFDSKPVRAEQELYDLARWVREQPELADWTPGEEPAQEEFERRLAAYLAAFGDTVYDLDFAKPLPAEDPAPLLQTLEFFRTGQAPDPHARRRAAERKREDAVAALRARRPGPLRALALRLLRWAQTMAPLREDALAGVGLGWPAVRRLLRELGGRLTAAGAIADRDEVFWLRLDELRDAVRALDDGRAPVPAHAAVAERRASWQARRKVPPPHLLPVGATKIAGIDISRLLPAQHVPEPGGAIKGVPGSPGRVTAPARVIHGPEEFGRMRQGDVLVAKITTPAWTPLFALASAIVTDVGGPLSHSSIVAREYHIPAVLGTGVATEHLIDGRQIIVDGDAGTVTPVADGSAE